MRLAVGDAWMKRKKYDKSLAALEVELVAMARWVKHSGQRVLVLVEGRDTAGKGGVIDAISAHINPRQCRTVAMGKPEAFQSTAAYLKQYAAFFPKAGEIVLFDRSWYNRAGVEQVMGFTPPRSGRGFSQESPRVRDEAGRRRGAAVQILAVLRSEDAGGALCRAARRSAQAMEIVADRYRSAQAL